MIEITVTVKTTNHGGETVFTKTEQSIGGNPRFDGEEVRAAGPVLVESIARQLDKLVGKPGSEA